MRPVTAWVAAAVLSLPSGVAAQVEAGASLSVSDVGGATFGLAVRLGTVVYDGSDWSFRIEAVGDVFFPECDVVECDALGGEVNLLMQRRYGGRYQAYVGARWMYEKVTLVQDNNQVFDGDDWGINLLLGNRLSSSSRVQPFIEVRISLMRELADQFAFSGGVRVPLGG